MHLIIFETLPSIPIIILTDAQTFWSPLPGSFEFYDSFCLLSPLCLPYVICEPSTTRLAFAPNCLTAPGRRVELGIDSALHQ